MKKNLAMWCRSHIAIFYLIVLGWTVEWKQDIWLKEMWARLKRMKLFMEEKLRALGWIGLVLSYAIYSDAGSVAAVASKYRWGLKLLAAVVGTVLGTVWWLLLYVGGAYVMGAENHHTIYMEVFLAGVTPLVWGSVARQAAMLTMAAMPWQELSIHLVFYFLGEWIRISLELFFGENIKKYLKRIWGKLKNHK